MATLLCFSLSIITLGNILVELEYAKNGVISQPDWSFDGFWTNLFPHIGKNYEEGEATVG